MISTAGKSRKVKVHVLSAHDASTYLLADVSNCTVTKKLHLHAFSSFYANMSHLVNAGEMK